MGVSPAVWTRVRVPKPWRCYVAHWELSWKEALAEYQHYAYYWRTGDF